MIMADPNGWLSSLVPAAPATNPIEGLIKALGSGSNDFLRTLMQPGYAMQRWGSMPTPAAQAAPGIGPGINLGQAGLPQILSRGMTPQSPTVSIPTGLTPGADGNLLPPPPMLPAPPQMAAPGGVDASGFRKFSDMAMPGSIDQGAYDKIGTSGVFGGIAAGAGSVDATEAGSFARALAMAGAGGSKAFAQEAGKRQSSVEQRERDKSSWAEGRARGELDVASRNAAASNLAKEVAFRNAQAIYDTNVKNQQMQYEQSLKETKLKMPEYEKTPGGFAIRTIGPDGNMTVRQVNTQPLTQSFEKLDTVTKALGGDDVQSDMLKVRLVSEAAGAGQLDPGTATQMLKQQVVDNLVRRNQAATVFGKDYPQLVKQIEAGLPQTVKASLMAKPEEYVAYLNKAISAQMFNMILKRGSDDWLAAAAAAGDPIAGVMLSRKQ